MLSWLFLILFLIPNFNNPVDFIREAAEPIKRYYNVLIYGKYEEYP